jgi:rubrerythrin
MAITFSMDEIFAMAERIERNGIVFYRKTAKGISNTEIQKVLEELAVMELDHEKTFAAMRAELTDSERMPAVFDPDDEVGMYLQSMADGRVFDIKADSSKKLTGRETPQDILNLAIGLEKDSIIFYLGLEEYVPAESGKDKIRTIIKQEMGHIALLDDKLKVLEQ